MRIGVDFDNTIACYDGVFHAAAVERRMIPAHVGTDKTSVRDYLRGLGRDADFTVLQGYIYGPGMKHVTLYPGLVAALRRIVAEGHALFVVSHKTKAPFAGPAYDLHEAARAFLSHHELVHAERGLFKPGDVFFELTKEEKVARIAALECDVFIDDLPEILAMDAFPARTRAVLFDPDGHYGESVGTGGRPQVFRDWPSIVDAILKPPPGA